MEEFGPRGSEVLERKHEIALKGEPWHLITLKGPDTQSSSGCHTRGTHLAFLCPSGYLVAVEIR